MAPLPAAVDDETAFEPELVVDVVDDEAVVADERAALAAVDDWLAFGASNGGGKLLLACG